MTEEALSNYLIIGAFLSAYAAFQFIPDWWLSVPLVTIAVVSVGAAHLLAPFKRGRFNLRRVGSPSIVDPSHEASAERRVEVKSGK